MDSPNQPEKPGAPEQQPDETYLTIVEAAKELEVDRRTVLRYILDGIVGPNNTRIRLDAKLISTQYGQEYQIRQSNLAAFKEIRSLPSRERTTGKPSGAQLVAGELELERLHAELDQCHRDLRMTYNLIKDQSVELERLAREAGQTAGENTLLREQLGRSRRGVLMRICDLIFAR